MWPDVGCVIETNNVVVEDLHDIHCARLFHHVAPLLAEYGRLSDEYDALLLNDQSAQVRCYNVCLHHMFN